MIAALAGVKDMVATRPVDFRKGADGLAALVREQLRHDPFSGMIFVFRSKRADRRSAMERCGSPPRSSPRWWTAWTGRVCMSTTLRSRL